MIVCPRGRTTSRCSLAQDMHSPYCNGFPPPSAPDCPIVLEVRVPIRQSASVSVVGCSTEDTIGLQCVSPMHPTHVLWDLNQRRTLASLF
ncbi:hypothetical protein TNCV_56991 [Trichonephila clavipes]|nr:hypothetical protein TNCV_56991 [Trichonephila clavipes]